MKPLGGRPGEAGWMEHVSGENSVKEQPAPACIRAATMLREPLAAARYAPTGYGGKSLQWASHSPARGKPVLGPAWVLFVEHLCALEQGRALGGSHQTLGAFPLGLPSSAGSLTLAAFLLPSLPP